MTTCQMSAVDDDIRRSIDVLDQVLSEFDDIEPIFDEECFPPSSDSPTGDQEVPVDPPPVDRSLKPKSSPPSLPQKTKKSFHESTERLSNGNSKNSVPSFNNTHTSQGSKLSETSSHEYQEINSDMCLLNSRRKSLGNEHDGEAERGRQRHRSNKEQSFKVGGELILKNERPLRKSRSEDISLISDEIQNARGHKNGRRHPNQRRGRSTDRLMDYYSQQLFDPRRLPELGPIDPRLIDPKFVDSRFIDPRFCDPRFIDPRYFDSRFMDPTLQNQRFLDPRLMDPKLIDPSLCDPRLLEPPLLDPPLFLEDTRIPFDVSPGAFPLGDPMHFPHLMTPPVGVPGPLSLPPPNALEFHPHTIPPYDFSLLQDALINPDHPMNYPYLMDHHFEGLNSPLNGFDPRLKNFDPSMLPPPMLNYAPFPIDFPMDLPFNYPPDFPPEFLPMHFSPRERLSYDERGRRFINSKDSRIAYENGWLPPTPEEARTVIQKLVRSQHHLQAQKEAIRASREKFLSDAKNAKIHGEKNPRRKSASNSEGSGRSSPSNGSKTHPNSKGLRSKSPSKSPRHSPNQGGVFRVGEAVRKEGQIHREFGGKDTVSLPHFVSGGKDSGFDESPVVDEASSLMSPSNRGGTPVGVGGGFVVAGVFSDSSKMYIPAPPSPTPDYDENIGTDGEDSDIPQEPFYVKSKVKKENSATGKNSSGSLRDSLSEDSLQEIITYEETKEPASKDTNPLQSMIAEFHMGLPPPPKTPGREEGRFSDDSLEEEDDESSSNQSPSRPSTINCNSQRPDSMESLISMDGSTTSFDYITDLNQRNHLPSNKKETSRVVSPSKKDKYLFKSNVAQINNNNFNNNKNNSNINNNKNNNNINNNFKFQNKTSFTAKNGDFKSQNEAQREKRRKGEIPSPSRKTESSKEHSAIRKLSSGSSEDSKKDFPKFDTIRHLIKEGLIEGLDETPPDFAPPPPPTKKISSGNEERADSGIGSTASTNNRTDESGGSDNQSEKLSGTPPKKSFENQSYNDNIHKKTPSPPPLPPPRDSSMSCSSSASSSSSNTQPLMRNQSWLYKRKPGLQETNHNHKSKNNSEMKNPSKHNNKMKKEKVTHIDDLRHLVNMNTRANKNGINDKLAIQYASPQDHQENEFIRNVYLENTKNLQSKLSSEGSSAIYDDQASVSSHGSRSGRFFSRFTESMKSGSRSNSPLVNKGNQQKVKRIAPKYHGDVIRAPRIKSEAPQPPILGRNPPEYKSSSDPPSIAPLSRDGSGRFRSIEDLPDISAGGKSLELKRSEDNERKKKKRNATLPPTITPADMLEHEKELARNKHKDETDGSKFRFNIFKGFWRRNKYSFDKM